MNPRILSLAPGLVLAGLSFCAQAAGPPCKVGDVVRAGVLNYDGKIIAHDAARGLYKVQRVSDKSVEFLAADFLKTCTGQPPPPVTEAYFAGQWEMFTGGGGHYEKTNQRDWHVVAGQVAKAPPLVIRKDGTYTWVIDSKTTVKGNWHVAQTNELKYGYDKRGLTIVLAKGEDGKDWLVSRDLAYAGDGRDAILIERRDLGLTYRGHKKS